MKQFNRKSWGKGPWENEPDRLLWKSQGFDCLINRNPLGSWCGYVGLPKGHLLYGAHYNELYDRNLQIEVHGGLTYSEYCQGDICHPHSDEDEGPTFWLGFDCAHAGDLVPSLQDSSLPKGLRSMQGIIYRDIEYVRGEVENLARQLAECST